ncbi:MarR family winged helix-turn-helix transcriptional regulator [Agrobacterium sp. 22-226-1]
MSSREAQPLQRKDALRRLGNAGRAMSDTAVMFHERAAEYSGLGVSDWKALGIIERSGPMTHRDLVHLIGLKPASVTNILDRLESRQWISRVKAEDDARRIAISVNEQKISAYRQQIFGSLISRLNTIYEQYSTEDLTIIADALEKIAQAQAAAKDDIPGV